MFIAERGTGDTPAAALPEVVSTAVQVRAA